MFCPKCEIEYLKGYTVCRDCRVPLVEERPRKLARRSFWASLGLILFVVGIAAGVFVWWFILPEGLYPRIVGFLPGVPFWLASYFCFHKARIADLKLPDSARGLAYLLGFLLAGAILFLALWMTGEL